jgi:4'-phosphopantetheinyl transferase EntD
MSLFTIACLVPPQVTVHEVFGVLSTTLAPEEDAILGSVSNRRRATFAMGRHCGREAMRKLGLAPGPILCGSSREPIWPPDVCGSITHCEDYTAAATALRRDLRSIGIDAENLQPLSASVISQIAVPQEQRWIESNGRSPRALLVFSAKESVFKAWFPIVGTYLAFEDVTLDFEEETKRFRALIRHDAAAYRREAPLKVEGRFHVDAERVVTTAFIPV